jgi:hypothetical protein
MSQAITEINTENKQKIKNILTCTLCSKLLCHPITLHCQETFCQSCIKLYSLKTKKQDCPSCHKDSFYQPTHNFKLWDLINKIFPDEVKAREEEIKKNTPKMTQEEQIKEEIIKNNWREIINKKNNPIVNNNQNAFFIEQLF